jgi:hypothetical protein
VVVEVIFSEARTVRDFSWSSPSVIVIEEGEKGKLIMVVPNGLSDSLESTGRILSKGLEQSFVEDNKSDKGVGVEIGADDGDAVDDEVDERRDMDKRLSRGFICIEVRIDCFSIDEIEDIPTVLEPSFSPWPRIIPATAPTPPG